MASISFGIIALNALPLLEYNLRALYPFAHQIIVVEGAARSAAGLAAPSGHSTDGTFEWLQRYKVEQDPENKLLLISASDEGYADGLWPEKQEMSAAYAKRVTGDWLWQVDSDEFYKQEDLKQIAAILDAGPDLLGLSFSFHEFWGGFDYVASGSWYLHEFIEVPRVFRWRPGYSYISHRPPTVADEHGRPLEKKRFLGGQELKKQGIVMYHYSYVLPKQARQKVGYYSNVEWTDLFRASSRWLEESYVGLKRPMFLGERGWPTLQWLERFAGTHPEAIVALLDDITAGRIQEELRPSDDIERLLASRLYALQKITARFFLAIFWPLRKTWKAIRGWVASLFSKKQTVYNL